MDGLSSVIMGEPQLEADPLVSALSMLSNEKYPRHFDEKEPDTGYWIASGLVMLVWSVTPMSW